MPQLKLFLLPILLGVCQLSATNYEQPTNTNHSVQEMFNYLRCHRQAKNIVVNWGMTSQLGVTRYIVYYSDNGEFFDPIAEIPADDVSSKYSFKHLNVFPGLHHYYIAAIRTGMPVVNSVTDVVRIVGH